MFYVCNKREKDEYFIILEVKELWKVSDIELKMSRFLLIEWDIWDISICRGWKFIKYFWV